MKWCIRMLNETPMFDYRQFCKITQGALLDYEEKFNPKD